MRYLKPLVLRDIAEAIEMHESTVSRVTSNKFIATPRGMFELKYFFTAAIASAEGGGAISAEAVRTRIKALIDAESPKKSFPTTNWWKCYKAKGSISPAARSPNIARPCAFRPRFSGDAKRPSISKRAAAQGGL